MSEQQKAPSLVLSVINNKCPHCRKGKMFTHNNPYQLSHTLEMHKNCPKCNGDLFIEPGFYFGTGYISYALSVATCVAWFVAYYVLFGISIYDNSLFIYLGTAIALVLVLQPLMMRLSRSIWIAIFQSYKGVAATQNNESKVMAS